nr:RICIN domain-containing protein [Paenibacillus hamazuiensis]
MRQLGQPRTGEVGPFLSAHRGAWGTDAGLTRPAPENSLIAIDNAADLKFEMVELDVKLSNANNPAVPPKLMLMHDYTLGRTTDYGSGDSHLGWWNPFLGQTDTGFRPQDYGDWVTMSLYNPLVKDLSTNAAAEQKLRLFDKSQGDLGILKGASAIGRWPAGDYGTVPTLDQALDYIGKRYPGMTVVVDLRHLNEVKAAVKAIDQVRDCSGRPANEWVILKPFANVFKGGFFNAKSPGSTVPDPESVAAQIPGYEKYKWIPVVSSRLVPPNPQGEPSIIPGSPGPDVTQIMSNVTQYLNDWARYLGGPVVTFEIGVGDFSNQAIKDAYNAFKGRMTNMQSWRPPDINVAAPVADPDNGNKTIVGFNWKDDGTGAYPVYKESSRSYEDTKKWAGALTIEDPVYVKNAETFTREATQLAISDMPDFGTFAEYALVAAGSGLAVDISDGKSDDGTPISLWSLHKLDNQLWSLQKNADGTLRLLNPFTGKSLDLPGNNFTNGTAVHLWSNNSSDAQKWVLSDNQDGTYRIVHAASGKVLDADNNGSANGTKLQIWDINGGINQKWRLIPVRTYRFPSAGGTVLMMGVANVSNYSGAQVELGERLLSTVRWRALNHADGTFSLAIIRPGQSYIHAGAMMLTPQSNFNLQGTLLQTLPVSGNAAQNWSLLYNNADASYTFRHPYSTWVADVSGGAIAPGTDLILFQSNGNANQRWKIQQE